MHFLSKLWPWVVCFSCHSFSVFPSVLQNIYYCYSQKKKDKKYSEEPECFAWQSLCGIGWVSESHGGLCANKQGLILLGVLEKWNVSVRFFYPCLCWARKRRHKCTCFSGCAALEPFGSLAPSPECQLPPPKLGASCVCETQAAAPTGEDTPQLPASSQSKLPLVCTGLTTRAKNENRLEKQQDACNSSLGVSENKIHLSSPDESLCFQMTWRENRSLCWNWKAG